MTGKETLAIRGKEINYSHKNVDIFDIKFFTENPRVATIVGEVKGQVTEEVIDKALWDRPETHKLKRSIEKDGGLIHPLLVYNNLVIEGNTRLCCYRHLYDETKLEKWRTIKCFVINQQLTQDEIYRLLCNEHIAGKIDWDAYDKANMFNKMKNHDGMKIEEIEDISGESSTSITYKIRAFTLMLENGVRDKEKYSHFEQLVTNGDIREIKKSQDPKIEQKIVERIKDGTIRRAPDIRKIGAIYKHRQARKRVFEQGEDVEQVYHDLKAHAPMTDSPIIKEVESLIKRVQVLERVERDAIKNSNRDSSKIEQLTRELINLCKEMDIKIHVPKGIRKG